MKEKVKAVLASVYARAIAYYRAYPARSISYVVAALVALGGLVGATVDADRVSDLLTLVLPILIGGEAVHRQVTPVAALSNLKTGGVIPRPAIQVEIDGRELAKQSVRHGDVDAPAKRQRPADEIVLAGLEDAEEAPVDTARCRHGHVIDGSNGAYCAHGHAG